MKKMTDKQKRIIAYIIAVWFAIFGTLGMVQTGLNIANCAGRNKETKKAYALTEEATTFRLLPQNGNDTGLEMIQNSYIDITFTAKEITIKVTNISQTQTENGAKFTYQGNIQGISKFTTDTIEYVNESTSMYMNAMIEFTAGYTSQPNGIYPDFIPTIAYQENYGTYAENEFYKNKAVVTFTNTDGTREIKMFYSNNSFTSEDIGYAYKMNKYYLSGTTNIQYAQGYKDGLEKGEQNVKEYGNIRYNAGVQDGIASANKYTFKGLISAVFDVPVQTLYGMLNFNILGINILSFIMSIVSVILLIAIVKVFL